jgi:hypothetical protein
MKRSLTIICLSLVALVGCNSAPQPNANSSAANQNPSDLKVETKTEAANPAQAVEISTDKIEIKAGAAGEAVVKLKIKQPFHVNANPPSEKNLIPTEISYETAHGIAPSKAVYPNGEMKTFSFSPNKPLSVYSGETIIKIPLKVAANAEKSVHLLNGKLNVQPCDDEVCYKPQTLDVVLAVNVK